MEEVVKDSNGNIIYRKDSDGYFEHNTYDSNNKLIRSEQHYPNGIIETEQYAPSDM